MLSHVAGCARWFTDDDSGHVIILPNLLRDLQHLSERSFSEERNILVLSAVQEASPSIASLLTEVDMETLTTTLMELYNTAHSIALRCSVMNALTSLACCELANKCTSTAVPQQQADDLRGADNRIPIWVSELYFLLVATTQSTSHRHLKQSMMHADALNYCALLSLDEILMVCPSIKERASALQRTRVAARPKTTGGKAYSQTEVVPLPTESLQSIQRVHHFRRVVEHAHTSGAYGLRASPPHVPGLPIGVKRSAPAVPEPSSSTGCSVHESLTDLMDHIDSIPRLHLPQVLRLSALVWNYEPLAPKLDRTVLATLSVGGTNTRRREVLQQPVSPPSTSANFSRSPEQKKDETPKQPRSGGQQQQTDWNLTSSALVLALCSSWIHCAKASFLSPPSFAPIKRDADGSICPPPPGHVLRQGDHGLQYYLDTLSNLCVSSRDSHARPPRGVVMSSSMSPLWLWESSSSLPFLVHFVDRPSLCPQARSVALLFAARSLNLLHAQQQHLAQTGWFGADPREASYFPLLSSGDALHGDKGHQSPDRTPSRSRSKKSHEGMSPWDTPQTLLLKVQSTDALRGSLVHPADVQSVMALLRQLRDDHWVIPAVRASVALMLASIVTQHPQTFIAPAAALLATCRASAILNSLHAVEMFEHDAIPTDDVAQCVARHTYYAQLLSAVAFHILVNETAQHIVQSFSVLVHTFGFNKSPLAMKLELLDHLAARIPELPNTWYCGHHVVDCCRVCLVSEIPRVLSPSNDGHGQSTETLRLVTTAKQFLDTSLRHFSNLAVAQMTVMILNAMQHLPLDTVGFLLDVSSEDVQDVLSFCERPSEVKPHNVSDVEDLELSIVPMVNPTLTAEPLGPSSIAMSLKLDWKIGVQAKEPYVGCSVELYDSLEASAAHGSPKPPSSGRLLASFPVPLFDIGQEAPLHFTLTLAVDDCAPKSMFPQLRMGSTSSLRSFTGDSRMLRIPFAPFLRRVEFSSLKLINSDSMPFRTVVSGLLWATSLDDRAVWLQVAGLLCEVFGIARCIEMTSDADCLTIDVVPRNTAIVIWESDGIADPHGGAPRNSDGDGLAVNVLVSLQATDLASLVELETLINSALSSA